MPNACTRLTRRPSACLSAALAGVLLLSAPATLLAGTNVWTRGSGLTTTVGSIAINPQNPAVLYATAGSAVYKSSDGGNNWESGTTLTIGGVGTASYNIVATNPQVPDYVYVGLAGWGVARSINGGGGWRLQNGSAPYTAGSGFTCPGAAASYCTNPATPHSGTVGNLPRSNPPGSVSALAFSRNNRNVGFAAYQGLGIFLTDDATRTTFCPLLDPDTSNTTLAGIDPDLPDACSAYGVGEPDQWPDSYRVNWGTGGATLAAGADSGASIPAGSTVNSLVIREAGPQVYAATNGQGIYLRTGAFTAAGAWAKTSCGAGGDTGNAVCNVQSLALSPDEQYLWAGTLNNGIWRADVSAGATTAWTKVSTVASSHACYAALQNVRTLAFASWFDATSGTTKTRTYAGSFGHGVCYTEDAGSTWTTLNQGLTDAASGSLLGLYVTSLAVDPLNPIRVYAGTYAGVYSIQIVPGSSSGGLSVSGTGYTTSSKTQAFGSVNIDQSLLQPLTVTNQGAVTVNFTGSSPFSLPSGPFSLESGCGDSLLPGASCQLLVTFAPTAPAAFSASLTINSDAIEGPIAITLTGTGVNTSGTTGTLTVTPASLSFGNVAIGSTGTQTLTLTAASGNVSLSGLTVPTGFEIIDQCGSLIPAGGSCNIAVIFRPDAALGYGGNLIVSNDSSTPLVYRSLAGNGTVSGTNGALGVTPASLAFGDVAIGAASSQILTLTASGGNIALSGLTVPTGFSIIDQCGSLIPAGGSCSIAVTFSPEIALAYGGNLIINSDSSTPLVYRALSGTGTQSGTGSSSATLSASPTSLSFGSVPVGSSASQTLTLTAGTGNVTLSGLTLPTGFDALDQCGSLIPAGASCTITLTFSPELAAPYNGNLLIASDSSTPLIYRALSATGTDAGSSTGTAALRLTVAALAFPTLPPGSSLELPVWVEALGGDVTLGTAATPAGFSMSSGCSSPIPAGTGCYLKVAFAPDRAGAFQGTLLIDDGSAQKKQLTLSGNSADQTALTASALGSASALTLLGHYRFGSWDTRGGGYYYVVAIYQDTLYFYDGRNWQRYAGETRPPFIKAGPFTSSDVAILSGLDVRGLSGVPVFLGYGSSIDDVIRNGKYEQVYTLP